MSEDLSVIAKALRSAHRRSYNNAQAMPGVFYTSPAFLALEEETLFRKDWICLGRTDELKEPGSFMATKILDEPLVITRDRQGKLRALSNVCRHRGMVIADGCGKARRLVCPYHHWSYDLDGQLTAAPGLEEHKSFKPDQCRLPALPLEVWQGMIFVSLAKKPKALAPRLKALEDRLSPYAFAEQESDHASESLWPTNWKCLMENFMEGYHLSALHRQSLHALSPTKLCEHFPPGEDFFGFNSGYAETFERIDNKNPEVKANDFNRCVMAAIPPSLGLSIGADYSSYIAIQPEGPDQVRVKMALTFAKDAWPDEKRKSAIELFESTVAEDKAALTGVYRGLASKLYHPGPLAGRDIEGTLLDFHRLLAQRLLHHLD